MTEQIPPAVQPTEQLLPLLALTPERFQSFCRDFIAELPGVVECHQYGVQGNPQLGIDLVATRTSGEEEAYQCRRVQTFEPADLRKLVDTVKYEASHYYALLACRATSGVRDEAKKHERWTVWDIDDISAKVRKLPSELPRRIVRTNFGGRVCREFLGVAPFTAFLTPDEFFEPLLDNRKIFNHCFDLVGREVELTALLTFTTDEQRRVYVLPGRGGIGKSKLLWAFAQRAAATHTVLFAQIDVDITLDALGELPLVNVILVIDDAHRRKDLGLLFAFTVRTRTKVVLSTRPQLRDELPGLASRHNLDASEMVVADDVAPLSREDIEILARAVLGSHFSHLAGDLALATRDCPLITMVGGHLLRERRVPPSLLANDDQFRETALSKFFDEIVEHAKPGSEEGGLRALLEVVAALAPVHVQTQRFASAATALTGMSYDTAAEWCKRLERHGVLARRRDGLRIVPDLLSDYILGVACARPAAAGQQFVERIVAAVDKLDPALLRNLAAVDWRVGRKTGEELRVLGAVWDTVIDTFKNAPNSERVQMLRQLREVGFFLPTQMLQLSRMAYNFPATASESGPFAAMIRTSHESVLAELPEAVRFTTYTPATFDSACDFLWRLANDPDVGDPRIGWGDKGPLAILTETMAPGLRKPRWVHDKLLARVDAWRTVADTAAARIGIIRIVAALFMKTGVDHVSDDDMSITMRSFALSARYLQDLRERARGIVAEALSDPVRTVVGAAVKALADAIHPPVAFAGLNISDADRAAWEPPRIAALEHLEELARRTQDPVIAVQLHGVVAWLADEELGASEPNIQAAARGVLTAIPATLPNRIARLVKNPWESHRPGVPDEEQTQVRQLIAGTAEELTKEMESKEAVLLIDDIISGLSALSLNPVPNHFLTAIACANPAFAAGMCTFVHANDTLVIAAYMQSLVLPFRSIDESKLDTFIEEIGTYSARRAAASILTSYVWWVPREESLSERDLSRIQRLFQMGGDVAIAGLETLPRLATHHPRAAVDMLLSADIGANQRAAEELAEAFDEPEHRLFDVISDEDLGRCLLKLAAVPQLDGTHLGEFVEECGRRIPLTLLDLLARRIEREGRDDAIRYTAIPLDPPELALPADVAGSPAYLNFLRRLRDDYMSGRAYDAYQLFHIAAADMNAAAIAFLHETSAERTDAALTFVAVCVRGEACRNLVLSDAGFVAPLFTDAAAVGQSSFEAVHSALLSCVIPRETTKELRHDIGARAAQMRDALPITSRARDFYDAVARELKRIDTASANSGEVEDDE